MGAGGNASRDPRNNLNAQSDFETKFNKTTKHCAGFIHFDGPEISISNFRQQKTNKTTGLQGRCDTCNRLYFSILQKPKVVILAICIWAEETGDYSWRDSVPKILQNGIEASIDYWARAGCGVSDCSYTHPHGSFRRSVGVLTDKWKNLERQQKTHTVYDNKTGEPHSAPEFMHAMQSWGATGGRLQSEISITQVWKWWSELYFNDQAFDSAELKAASKSGARDKLNSHPITDFSWGSGNILETIEGHSVPGFNQVKGHAKTLKKSSSSSSRVYSFLVEGDRLAMMKLSRECKGLGMSLGHSPAPLRWLGKDDPINGKAQPLTENVLLRDSLIDLYKICQRDPEEASQYVSWQIRDLVSSPDTSKLTFEAFSQKLESAVEKYLDDLLEDSLRGGTQLLKDIKFADPGKTENIYSYRVTKVKNWLMERPTQQRELK